MNLADRIQYLRKAQGISQEGLADQLGVSRQAVSKWESEQSMPDLDKIISLSEHFDVTTDYLLKGIEPVVREKEERFSEQKRIASQICGYIALSFVSLGVILSFMLIDFLKINQLLGPVFINQGVGLLVWGIGLSLSDRKPSWQLKLTLLLLLLFVPFGFLSNLLFAQNRLLPYPTNLPAILAFVTAYLLLAVCLVLFLKKHRQDSSNMNLKKGLF